MPSYIVELNRNFFDNCQIGLYEKKGTKSFFCFGTTSFILKSLVLHFLGPTEMIL